MKLSVISILAAFAVKQALATSLYFWTVSSSGEAASQDGFTLEGVNAYVPLSSDAGVVPMYRWVNSAGVHFWTTSTTGEGVGSNGYTEEGIAYYVFNVNAASPTGTVPFYRFVDSNIQHFYTTSLAAGNSQGFTLEGTVGYVYTASQGSSVPLYQWYQ